MTVQKIQRPELFFALVAPVGVDLDMIIQVFSTELNRQNYSSSLVKVTDIMRDVKSSIKIISEPYLESIKSRIEYADDVCAQLKRQDALAAIAISAIQSEREKLNRERNEPDPSKPISAHAFIGLCSDRGTSHRRIQAGHRGSG